MPNRIIQSIFIKNTNSSGRSIALKFATRTDNWRRGMLAQSVKDEFCKAMEKSDIPAEATTAILAEAGHPSGSDSKGYFTTVFQDRGAKHITTKHIYP